MRTDRYTLALGVLASPLVHRFLHASHIERTKKEEIRAEERREEKKAQEEADTR